MMMMTAMFINVLDFHEDRNLDVEGERVGGLVGNLDGRILVSSCCRLVGRSVRQRFSITLKVFMYIGC